MRLLHSLRPPTAGSVTIPIVASAALTIALIALAPSGMVAGEDATPEEQTPSAVPTIELVDGELQLLPIIAVKRSKDMFVTVAIRNNTARPVTWSRGGRFGLESLELRLTREDGTVVPYVGTESSWRLFEEPATTLNPDETTLMECPLREFGFDRISGNFPAGRYELRAVQSPTNQPDSTPMRIDRAIMLLDVAGKPLPPETDWIRVAVVVIACLAVAEAVVLICGYWYVWRNRSRWD